MRQYEDVFSELNVAVAVVAFDANVLALNYVKQTRLRWPLLIDRDQSLYRSYGMGRANWWAIYGPASIWQYLKLIFQGRQLRKPGSDWQQLGGDVLIDPAGIIRLHYVSESPHDRPTPNSIINLVGR